jgi:hypothetical protein
MADFLKASRWCPNDLFELLRSVTLGMPRETEANFAGTQLARDIAVGVRRMVSLADGRHCLPSAL